MTDRKRQKNTGQCPNGAGKIVLCLFLCLCLLIPSACVKTDVEKTKMHLSDSGASFSHDSGAYPDEELTVTVAAPKGFTIAYTTDGTLPGAENDSGKSQVQILLKKQEAGYLYEHREAMMYPDFEQSRLENDASLPSGRVLNTALCAKDGTVSGFESHVYFLSVDFAEVYPDCLVISVAADPQDLLDYNTGILAAGAEYDRWRQSEEGKSAIENNQDWKIQSNCTMKGREWERQCRIQIYDRANEPFVQTSGGMRVHGGASRTANQKGFNFYLRDAYGSVPSLSLFGDSTGCTRFVLRNGGNAVRLLKYRDDLLQELCGDRQVTVLKKRPAVLFLNGEYWGVYTLMEKLSAETLNNRYGVDEDQVVIVKEQELEEGNGEDIRLYEELMSFADRDLSDPQEYEAFCDVMDVRSMADLFAIRIYIGDEDFRSDRNAVLWCTRDKSFNEGRWQYILYDTEYSSGLYDGAHQAAWKDHLSLMLERHPLFASAMRNDEFYGMFLEALEEIGSDDYAFERVEDALEKYDAVWRPLMDDHYKRFGDDSALWDLDRECFVCFFQNRYDPIVRYVTDYGKTTEKEQ